VISAGVRAAVVVLVPVLASASAGASTARRPVALAAAPARVVLTGSGRVAVRVTNSGSKPVVVDASRAGFGLSLHGRPRIVRAAGGRSAARWLKLEPTRFALPARTSASLVVSARVPRAAEPGDHDGLVLLTTRRVVGAGVGVRVRLGVLVIVRAPGNVVRRLELRGLRAVRRGSNRRLELTIVNRGNVTETLGGVRATVWQVGARRSLENTVAARRDLRPHTRGVIDFRLRRLGRGGVTVRIVVPAASGRRAIRRTYELRL
jgi:hypothetical protein